jgi:tetratricopeptide (TPR) repeat protein
MIDNHERLIEKGLEHHEAFRYSTALPYFKKAYKLRQNCPCAIYNLANTLHMLGYDSESKRLLQLMLKTPDSTLRDGCPNAEQEPASFKLDAFFLLFHVVLYQTGSWAQAFPYAQEHLNRRRRGLSSVWSKRTVLKEIEDYRKYFERVSNQRRHRTR